MGLPFGRGARDGAARCRTPARSHVRHRGPVRRAGDGVRHAGVRPARASRRAADPGRDRDRRPRVLRDRGDPGVDGRAHAVRRRLRARRGPLLRTAERLHRPADRRVPVDRAAAPNRRRLRAPGRRRAVRRAALPRREPRRGRVAVRGGRAMGRDPRTRTARRLEGPRGVRRRDPARDGPDPRGPRDLAVRDARDEVRGAGGRARRCARDVRGPAPGRVRPDRAEPVRADPGARPADGDRGGAPAAGRAAPEPGAQPRVEGRDPRHAAGRRRRVRRERLGAAAAGFAFGLGLGGLLGVSLLSEAGKMGEP